LQLNVMNKVCIGIHVYAEPERLVATLGSVRATTRGEFQLVLLPDGPDPATATALTDHGDLPQLGSKEPNGGAACFNRLAQYNDADLIVLLESGALVGSNWLDHLISALNNDPRNGLVGPSTNCSWNEQAVFPSDRPLPIDPAAAALDVIRRFGTTVRTLEPLYSLSDFCYGVRREVIKTIGLADEGYGLGPCWEMDYNVRAARAGWRGVWACAAYVHRAPFPARRQSNEARLFESSKRRYQEKFCGARLRGEKSDYRVHCRGDACPNFAPANLIQISHPSSAVRLTAAQRENFQLTKVQIVSEEPLVSCIMPTSDRLTFVLESIRCFFRQDYPNLELVIVDDGATPVASILPSDPRLRLIRLAQKKNVGAKRNVACLSAQGEYIAHWDDDDWYPADRIRRQVAALEESRGQICGTSTLFYYDAATRRAWRFRYHHGGRAWVGGNTLAYRKSWWASHTFPEIQVGEDSRFVWSAPAGAVCDLAAPDLCVSRIHPGNTSPKHAAGPYWLACSVKELEQLLGAEWPRFLSVSSSARQGDATPLVSCIMPTFNRRKFLPLALECFVHQDYPAKELIIVDDGTDIVRDLFEGAPDVRYLHLPTRASIGEKRNRACVEAQGTIIAHWDDDDWYAPNRLRHQIGPLLSGQADMTGLENSCLLELPSARFWLTRQKLHARMFLGDVHGGTLVYRRQLFSDGLRYPPINLAEDAAFILAALRSGRRLSRLSNDGVFVYVRHVDNAWKFQPGQFLDPDGWGLIAPPAGFTAEKLSAYREAANCTNPLTA
jgi:glycosyltransferase involved in cell wall biosynthesis